MNDKIRRNIWLVLTIISVGILVARFIQVCSGETEWWQVIATAVILGFCFKFFSCYRKKVMQEQDEN